MNPEQERADFEAWCHTRSLDIGTDDKGDYISLETHLSWEAYQAGRAALQSHKPKLNDLMLSGVLRMPFKMAMATELSRYQFYRRAQQAISELDALQSRDREDAERYRHLVAKLQQAHDDERFESECFSVRCRMSNQQKGSRAILAEIAWRDKPDEPIGLSEAIDHARRIEENK